MNWYLLAVCACCGLAFSSAGNAADDWWNARWRMRTTVNRATPWADTTPRPVEVAVDFPLLLRQAKVAGEFDPASVRVVQPVADGDGRQMQCVVRTEYDARARRERTYVAWIAEPTVGQTGSFDIYFDTKDRGIEAAPTKTVPPENLLANPGFEDELAGWTLNDKGEISSASFAHTTGEHSLKIAMGSDTPEDQRGEVTVSQMIDVAAYAGQEVVFECDLLATRGRYGTGVSVELQQFRADGSRIIDYAIPPRWLTVELAEGHFVQLGERGIMNPEVARVNVMIRVRPYCRESDDGSRPSAEEQTYEVYLDRVVVRPGERWPWPGANEERFVAGVAEDGRAVDFTGLRRVSFNGASEGTLTGGTFNPDRRSAHWGLQAGTLEMWIKPHWSADDDVERLLFSAKSIGHKLHSRLRKLAGGDLEFAITDADCVYHTISGPAPLQAETWHHLAVTWDYPRAQLQMFVDGQRVAAEGPADKEWAWTLDPKDPKRNKGRGIVDDDRRSLPMQATIGGDNNFRAAANAVIDEFRVSDVARYQTNFEPSRATLPTDDNTRALFHFDGEGDGVHSGDDGRVEGYFCHELPPVRAEAVVESFDGAQVTQTRVEAARPGAEDLFEQARAESVMEVTRPFEQLPDPRFIEYRVRSIEATVSGDAEPMTVQVGGDWSPLMLWETYERAADAGGETTLLPRWRANDNVVPFSADDIRATLAVGIEDDRARAVDIFRYALKTTNYFDAHYCESHRDHLRSRVSYRFIKDINIYPFDQCGPLNHVARKLFLNSGISSNDCAGTHHQFEQAFFDGSLQLFDLSPRKFWLDRDNETVVGLRDIYEDPWVKVRDGSTIMAYIPGRTSRARLGSATLPHRIDLALRPGERISVGWHNEGRWSEMGGERKRIPLAKIPPMFGNGAIVFEPTGAGDAATLDNALVEQPGAVRADDPHADAALVYDLVCPYLLSGATLDAQYAAEQDDAVSVWLSFDEGANWREVWRSKAREGRLALDLSEDVMARYDYRLKIELAASSMAKITGLRVRTTLINSPLSLPAELKLGENAMSFVAGPAIEPVIARLAWVERHKSDLGLAPGGINYYNMDDENHRSLFVAAPDETIEAPVTLMGRAFDGTVALEGLPEGWVEGGPVALKVTGPDAPATAIFAVTARGASEGDIVPFEIVAREGDAERRVWAQLLVASTTLVSEAEAAEASGEVAAVEDVAMSGASVMTFAGDGELSFDANASSAGKHAVWVRTRRDEGASTRMTLGVEGETREVRLTAMIGFTDWTGANRAHAKMFAHYGEAYGHWNWYRIPDVELPAGPRTITLGCHAGAQVDAVLVVPESPEVDRATMNLLQNWNFAPWHRPM
jgi:hypothetical protein